MTTSDGEDVAVEFQALAHAAASAVVGPPSSACQHIEDVHFTLHRIRSEMLFERNSHHPLLSLPQALLHRIFEFLEPAGIWAVSQACRCLRSSSIALPHLWTAEPHRYFGSLSPPDTSRLDQHLSLLAERSSPLSFDLVLKPLCNYDEISAAIVARFLPRLRSLWASPASPDGWRVFLNVLTAPAPLLEKLLLSGTMVGDRFSLPSAPDLLGGQPGSLRCLQLYHVALPLAADSYPTLSKLRTFGWHDPQSLELNARDLCRILALLPRLETLYLSVRTFTWGTYVLCIPGPLFLKSVSLVAELSINVLRCAHDLGLSLFRFTSLYGYEGFLDELVRAPLTVRLGLCTSEVVQDWHRPLTVAGDEALAMVVGVPFVRAHVSPALFGALAQLSIFEFFWPPADIGALPPLPVLHTLRVTLAPCACYSQYWDPPLGVLLGFDMAAWDAPALSVVHFDYWLPTALTYRRPPPHRGCRETPLAICLMDVYHFVSVCLPGPRARPLAEIRLRGVECVDPDPWLSFGLLEAIAEEVSVSAVPEPTQFDLDDQKSAAQHRGF